ncbi:MAG: DUF1573 domain-containing protein [Planctomycetota bacterium]|nr:DUF1573 domain-containing protein [Planctomycetota bacterium]
MSDSITPLPSRQRRPMTGVLVLLGLVVLAILAWLVLQWIISPPLSGERYHDYGIITLDEIPTYTSAHIFRLENTSGESVTIRKVIPSCGCTEIAPFEKTIPAGGMAEIVVRMKLKRSVREKADITITFEDSSPMQLEVEAAGRLANPLIIEPRGLRMQPGQVRPVTVAMETWDDQPRSMPKFELPEGISIKTPTWKRVRVGNAALGKSGLERTTIEVTVPEDAQPMQSSIKVILEDQVVDIPLVVVAPREYQPIQDDRNKNKTFNPLDRSGLQETPEE